MLEIKMNAEALSAKQTAPEVDKLMKKFEKEESLYQGNNWFNKLTGKKIA